MTDLLPQWRDEQQMVRWINDRLDEMKRDRVDANALKNRSAFLEHQRNLGPEIEAAENDGDVEPLKAKILERLDLPPDLAERVSRCITVPPRRHGERRHRKFRRDVVVNWAAMDVDRIKALWLENYGRKDRLATDGPSAFQIAAMRWKRKQLDISADDVHSRWKRLHEPSLLRRRKLTPLN